MKNGKQVLKVTDVEVARMDSSCFRADAAEEEVEFTGPSETVEVMLMHEDLQTGLRAKSILDNLEAKLGRKTRFLVDLWRFDMLQEPDLRDQAIRDGKRASIVIISLHGNLELPLPVREWFNRWITSRNADSCALVVSLDARVQGTVAAEWTLDYLRRAAAPAGLDLFPHFGTPPGRSRDWTVRQSGGPYPPAVSLHRTGRTDFGGIND